MWVLLLAFLAIGMEQTSTTPEFKANSNGNPVWVRVETVSCRTGRYVDDNGNAVYAYAPEGEVRYKQANFDGTVDPVVCR